MKIYTIGVDLGGTNIKAGLVDEAHHIVGQRFLQDKSAAA